MASPTNSYTCKFMPIPILLCIAAMGTPSAGNPSATAAPGKLVIYVSPDGDDSREGTSRRPIQSLNHAADLAKGTPGAVIRLAKGSYTIDTPVVLPPSTSVIGAGIGKTVLIYQKVISTEKMEGKGIPSTFALQMTGGNGTTLKNFTLNGTVGTERAAGGIYLKDTEAPLIQNVQFQGLLYAGLWLDRSVRPQVVSSQFDDCGRPSSSHCTPSIGINEIEGGQIANCTITEHRGAYGIKSLKPEWEGDHWPKPVSHMRDLRIHHNTLKLRQSGAWGQGQPNMAIEFWNCNSQNVELDHNTINVCTSLVGESAGPRNYWVHDNRFELELGYSYAMEISVNNVLVERNYFSNGCYPIANFGGPIENLLIQDNIFDNVESVRVLSFGSGIRKSAFVRNTVVVAKPLPLFQVDAGKDPDLAIHHNIFACAGDPNFLFREGGGEIPGLGENLFVNWQPVGPEGRKVAAAYRAEGKKPWPFFRTLDGFAAFGASASRK